MARSVPMPAIVSGTRAKNVCEGQGLAVTVTAMVVVVSWRTLTVSKTFQVFNVGCVHNFCQVYKVSVVLGVGVAV